MVIPIIVFFSLRCWLKGDWFEFTSVLRVYRILSEVSSRIEYIGADLIVLANKLGSFIARTTGVKEDGLRYSH